MEYFDQESAYEFELLSDDKLRCWHITGSSIDIKITIMQDNSLRAISLNGKISERANPKLFKAINRAYKQWKLI